MGEFLDLIDDVHYGLRKLFKKNKSASKQPTGTNVKRWAIELGVALVVGILTGCITYGLLNKEDKSLKVKEENAVAIQESPTPATGDAEAPAKEEPQEEELSVETILQSTPEATIEDIDVETYLFDTDNKVYSASDFSGLSPEVIHIAKNEIYARHGYSFKDQDIYNYFMGQVWYSPSIMPKDFTEDIFTETEVKNLDMLNSIDKM